MLDIFGFEIFQTNSFEQLCINFTNESLHNLFIEHVFKLEQETYIREEVDWQFVEYEDNQHTIDLISKRPVCLYGLLDEGCASAFCDMVLLLARACTNTTVLRSCGQRARARCI